MDISNSLTSHQYLLLAEQKMRLELAAVILKRLNGEHDLNPEQFEFWRADVEDHLKISRSIDELFDGPLSPAPLQLSGKAIIH